MNSDIESKLVSPSRCSECGALKGLGFGSFDMPAAPGTRHRVLLNSNKPPDESELTFFRSVVLKIESSLTSLDDEIANLREKLARLEGE
ncbi:hypothetical protein DFH08DRAFT_756460 [Mycena albidolilacea]|uniref:Uncharacterized protein n=1 Tax=Mycena albidolilacea TaxID=1033008 RepID=A0AAD6Z918_9AGAR|nr:hypothetical protein DFH08DRAFT_756460 [Mycena albidolilacea]